MRSLRPLLSRRGKLCLTLLSVGVVGAGFLFQRTAPLPPPLEVAPPAIESLEIRINLTDEPRREWEIQVDGPCQIGPLDFVRPHSALPRLNKTTVQPASDGIRIGGRTFALNDLEIRPRKPATLWVEGHRYRGRLRLHPTREGRIQAINVVPLEAYLASVVDSEMPARWPPAAREAQAIVARTFALFHLLEQPRHPVFDLYASSRSQRYLGHAYRARDGRLLAGETEAGRKAVAATSRMALIDGNGRLFCCYYAAACGGRTVNGSSVFKKSPPVLRSVRCDWCREAKRYRWEETISRERWDRVVHSAISPRHELRPPFSIRAISGWGEPSEFVVSDGYRQARLTGRELRRELGLNSDRFELIRSGESIILRGRGHGHGVGLCQWGARGQALEGRTARQILDHYYPGSRLVRMTSPY